MDDTIIIGDEDKMAKAKAKGKPKEIELTDQQLEYLSDVEQVRQEIQYQRSLIAAPSEHNKETYTLHISSEHADEYSTDANGNKVSSGFKLNLDGNIIKNEGGAAGSRMVIQLTSAEIPNTWYNIDSYNNKFEFVDNTIAILLGPPGTTFQLVQYEIPPGHYTEESLALALQLVINTNTQIITTYSVDYDDTTHSFLIVGDNAVAFYFRFNFDINNSIFNLLGFQKQQYDSVVYGSVHTKQLMGSYQATQLTTAENVYVTTSLNIKNVYHPKTSGVSNVLAKIPVKNDKKSILHYEQTVSHTSKVDEAQISFLVLKLVNDSGNLLNLNGHHWTCTIIITVYPLI